MTDTPDLPVLPTVTHVAGLPMAVHGRWFRQKCAWCDTVLVDMDQRPSGLLGPEGAPINPTAIFAEPGSLLRAFMDGDEVVRHTRLDGNLPPDFCGATATFAPAPEGALCGAGLAIHDDRFGSLTVSCERPPHLVGDHEAAMGATTPNTGKWRWTGDAQAEMPGLAPEAGS